MRALITGVSGQDGSYLAEYLHGLGYEVWGLLHSRRAAAWEELQVRLSFVKCVPGDMTDRDSLSCALLQSQPDEIYNLAAFTHAGDSFKHPEYTMKVNGFGAENLFDLAMQITPSARIYQASSSEMYGRATGICDESTPFTPVSPYGVSKLYAHIMADTYRKQGMWIACGIAFNHESPRRDPSFVTRKITLGLARCKLGLQDKLLLGNLEARRDWGYAPEYVEGFHKMLQRREPKDYVLATGISNSVRAWLATVSELYGLNWENYIEIDPSFYRPTDIPVLVGDAKLAEREVGWIPLRGIRRLAEIMCEVDMEKAEEEAKVLAYR